MYYSQNHSDDPVEQHFALSLLPETEEEIAIFRGGREIFFTTQLRGAEV